jgi:hypothetical protein
MPRPIETVLALPRVRLFNRVPILETEELVRRFIDRMDYRQRLVRDATEVCNGSAHQFSSDDSALSSLLTARNVTVRGPLSQAEKARMWMRLLNPLRSAT